MVKYIIKKLAMFFGLLVIILTINFILIRVMPGDPLENILGQENYYHLLNKNPERLEELRMHYGIDGTLTEQFVSYIQDIFRLDFGYSYTKSSPVAAEVFYQMKWTIILLLPAIVISAVVGAILGMAAGWNKGESWIPF